MKQLHTILMGSAAMGLAALATNPASAAEVKKSFKFSGQMNKAISFTNDGDSTYRDFADPENSKSRMLETSKSALISFCPSQKLSFPPPCPGLR